MRFCILLCTAASALHAQGQEAIFQSANSIAHTFSCLTALYPAEMVNGEKYKTAAEAIGQSCQVAVEKLTECYLAAGRAPGHSLAGAFAERVAGESELLAVQAGALEEALADFCAAQGVLEEEPLPILPSDISSAKQCVGLCDNLTNALEHFLTLYEAASEKIFTCFADVRRVQEAQMLAELWHSRLYHIVESDREHQDAAMDQGLLDAIFHLSGGLGRAATALHALGSEYRRMEELALFGSMQKLMSDSLSQPCCTEDGRPIGLVGTGLNMAVCVQTDGVWALAYPYGALPAGSPIICAEGRITSPTILRGNPEPTPLLLSLQDLLAGLVMDGAAPHLTQKGNVMSNYGTVAYTADSVLYLLDRLLLHIANRPFE